MDNALKYTKLGVPKEIYIGEYTYTFNKELKGDKFSYRCLHRKCPILLTITKIEINKLMNEQSTEGIKIEITNQHNMALHKNKANTIINHQKITLSQPNNQIAETLINSSIEKTLKWHITNLKANHINLNKNKVKYLLYKNRN